MNDCRLLARGEHEVLETTIQHLYGLALKLEACLQEAAQAGHKDKLDSAIDGIGELIDRLRTRIEFIESRMGDK